MGGRTKDSVQVDKYALENVLLANETTAKEVSKMIGHAGNYLSQVFHSGGYMKRKDYENLKGLLRVTDSDIIKAVPIQRSEPVENIYSAYPVKKSERLELDEANAKFIDLLVLLSGKDKMQILNGIVREFAASSELSSNLYAAIDAIKEIAV